MRFYRLLLCLLMFFSTYILAQDSISNRQPEGIIKKINRLEHGKGSVMIIQDDKITEKLGKPEIKSGLQAQSSEDHFIKVSGWRIQVFSGNNQRISKNEAFTKETDIKSVFPELSTYVKYNAPFWRLRVGDFQTFQDAQNKLVELRHLFPDFGREMSIVKEKIQVKVQ
jgi:hypothetical protein